MMITHLMLGANDMAQSIAFYDAALGPLGIKGVNMGERAMYRGAEGPPLMIVRPANGEPASHANGGTIGFGAPNMAAVDAFHAAGLANGGTDEGAPGPRPNAPGKAYGAYLRDPAGNKICAFCQIPD
jgi:catechol 2,3-dioxygenase-like lactoylglutathione lyase family enzyme